MPLSVAKKEVGVGGKQWKQVAPKNSEFLKIKLNFPRSV